VSDDEARQEAEAQRILAEAKRICREHGTDETLTLVGAMNDQFVVIFHVASLQGKDPAVRDAAITAIASKMHDIKAVARVCYEVLPHRKSSH
jgi:hypothetical protein